MDRTTIHMYEYHAINSEEMTTCMKIKIRENIRESLTYEYHYRDNKRVYVKSGAHVSQSLQADNTGVTNPLIKKALLLF
ncbi:MAG: hypothetical protein ACRD8W_05055 [Nitrososphaeraceae archaeon]